MPAPFFRDEPQRLAALHSYGMLDTGSEQEFDDLAALAAQICDTPIALISLVDESRQWFKAKIGTALTEAPRETSICNIALGGTEPLIVTDASLDPRFTGNPLVSGDPRLRFYAGAPLVAPGGEILGTLCVMDRVPRHLTPEQIRCLGVLARQVMTHLELRRNLADPGETEAAHRRAAESQAMVLNALPAHIALIDARGFIDSVNESWRRFAAINGMQDEDFFTGRNYLDICEAATGEGSEGAGEAAAGLREVLAGRLPEYTLEYPCDTPTERRWFRLMATPLSRDRREGAVVMHIDITERKRAEEMMARSESLLAIASRTARLGGWTIHLPEETLEWSDEIRAIHEVGPDFTPTLEQGIEFYLPEDREKVSRMVDLCTRNGAPFDEEFPIITAKGRRIWVRVLGEAVRDAAGEITRIQGAFQDITHQKQAEEENRRLAERLAGTLESITDGFFTIDRDWRFTYVNAAAERMMRRHRSGLLGRTIWKEFPETLGSTFEREYRRALDENSSTIFQEYFPPLEKWFEVRVYPSDQGLAIYFLDVTDARRSREALQASEERFRTLVETAPDAIFIQTGGRFAYANDAALRLYGADRREQLIGRLVLDLSHPDERPAIRQRIRRLNEDRRPVPAMDHTLLTLADEPRHVSVSAVPFSYEKQDGALVFARDITQRKLAEAELADSRRALQMLSRCNEALIRSETEADLLDEVCRIAVEIGGFRLAWVGYAIDDEPKTIEPRASAGAGADYLGDVRLSWSAEAPQGRGPAGRVIRDGRLVVVPDVTKDPDFEPWREGALSRGFRGVIALPLKSQRTFGVLVLFLPEPRDPKADELRLLHDLADDLAFGIGNLRMRAERLLVQQELSRQAALLDKARDAILVRDLDHRVLYWNQGAQRIYGWTAAEITGRPESELIASDLETFDAALEATLADGEWSGDIPQVAKDARPIVVEARWTLVRNDEGAPESILVINTDVTERRNLERQFLRSQRLDSIGTLAGGIAHDLNNVLSPILMSMELLKLDETDSARLEVLDTIEGITRRGADMVSQVLSFARGVESRQIRIQVGPLVREIEKIVGDTFPKNIKVESRMPPDLRDVRGDPTQLHQVLLNLCVNARDAMPDGGLLTLDASNVTVSKREAAAQLEARPGPYVLLEVQDTGTGMSPEVIDRIFEPFFTTKDLDKGTGLGLSTTLAIVRSHGGFLRVFSGIDAGTRFLVYLPALDESPVDNAAPGPSEIPRGNGELVLVVDDEPAVREITRRTLEIFGYRAVLAADGAEATAIYSERGDEIAVVLTDMMMPVMDGPATIAALLQLDPQVKIIAASGLSSKAVDAGVRDFIPKPYAAETLLKLLHRVLRTAP